MSASNKKLSLGNLYGYFPILALLLCTCAQVKDYCGDYASVAAGTPCLPDNVYTVSYNINGGSGTPPPQQTVTDGNSVTLANGNVLTKTGFTFGGWNTSANGTGTNYPAGATYTPNASITLYAKWNDAGGGNGCTYTGREQKIGNLTWMAENLNCVTDSSWCYANDPNNCKKYGRLYKWETAKTLCSEAGWSLPDINDWENLTLAVGGWGKAGPKLRSKDGWSVVGGFVGGTDEYGFSALPGGYRYIDGDFRQVNTEGLWWSASEHTDGLKSRYIRMASNLEPVNMVENYDKAYGLSVRCVRR
ncbi:MAG: InlB B-repeat-containing protein [Chitinispirillia bacterium]|nr:InlB B-repeat-containing protein [Chitinispirillia bacterium]MCL2242141.1 InlB B-repeat-containing protein [Chitinispirillia bacterium]